MKGIYFDGKHAIYRDDLPMPKPMGTESLIRIYYGGVCSTDREVRKGYRPDFRGIMGHEFVGIVEKSPDGSWVGKRVVGEFPILRPPPAPSPCSAVPDGKNIVWNGR